MKRPLEVVLRDRVEMKVRRGVTVLVRADGEVQYAVTDLDGVARFRVREVPTVAIVIDGVESSHALAPHDGRVRRIAIER